MKKKFVIFLLLILLTILSSCTLKKTFFSFDMSNVDREIVRYLEHGKKEDWEFKKSLNDKHFNELKDILYKMEENNYEVGEEPHYIGASDITMTSKGNSLKIKGDYAIVTIDGKETIYKAKENLGLHDEIYKLFDKADLPK